MRDKVNENINKVKEAVKRNLNQFIPNSDQVYFLKDEIDQIGHKAYDPQQNPFRIQDTEKPHVSHKNQPPYEWLNMHNNVFAVDATNVNPPNQQATTDYFKINIYPKRNQNEKIYNANQPPPKTHVNTSEDDTIIHFVGQNPFSNMPANSEKTPYQFKPLDDILTEESNAMCLSRTKSSTTFLNPDGTTTSVNADGTTTCVNADGTTTCVNADGKITEDTMMMYLTENEEEFNTLKKIHSSNKIEAVNNEMNDVSDINTTERRYTWIAPADPDDLDYSSAYYEEDFSENGQFDELQKKYQNEDFGSGAPVPGITYVGVQYADPEYQGLLNPICYALHAVEVHQYVELPAINCEDTSRKPWFMRNHKDLNEDSVFGAYPLPFNPAMTGMPAATIGSKQPAIAPLMKNFFDDINPTRNNPFKSVTHFWDHCVKVSHKSSANKQERMTIAQGIVLFGKNNPNLIKNLREENILSIDTI